MKKLFTMLLLIGGVLLFNPGTLLGQDSDTLDFGLGNFTEVSTIINGDTLAGGGISNPNRVYRFARGLIYPLDATLKVRGSFKMIAAEGEDRPPVLSAAILPDNSSIARYIELYGGASNVEFNDIYFLGLRNDEQISDASNSAITVLDSAISLKVRRCIIDGYGARGIQVLEAGVWSKIDVQDSKFRNIIFPGGSWLFGQAFKTTGNTYPLDTVKFINNTFLACGSYIFGVSGYVNYALFEHNTILYGIGNTFLNAYNTNVHIKNNVIYSAFTAAGYRPAVYGDWFFPRPDTISSSVIVINIPDTVTFRDTTLIMPGMSYIINNNHRVTADMIDDFNRVQDISHNAYYYPDELLNFIDAYNDTVQYTINVTFPGGSEVMLNTIEYPRWINGYTEDILASELSEKSPLVNIDLSTTHNEDPGFNDADAVNHISEVIGKLSEILTDNISPDRWTYKLAFPPAWPLPEDLAYSNANLQTAAEGGFPLGDLNWFPEEKAAWEVWVTDVDEDYSATPKDFRLLQNYPNPFNPTTAIKFQIPQTSNVSLKIYDVLGREVASLLNKEMNAGSHQVIFNASSLASGIYFYTLETGSFIQTKKMILMK